MAEITVETLSKLIGKTGLFSYDDFADVSFGVVVNDAKLVKKQVKYLISPVNGKGRIWVNADRVELAPVWSGSGQK